MMCLPVGVLMALRSLTEEVIDEDITGMATLSENWDDAKVGVLRINLALRSGFLQLADGNHRVTAASRIGLATLPVAMCVMVEEHLDHRAGAELGSRCLDKLRVAIAQRKLSNKSRLYLRLDDFSLPVMGLGYFLPERPGDFWLEDYVVVANKAEGDCLFEALSYLGGDVRLADRRRQGVCDVLLTMGSEVPPSSDAASAILDSVREQCLVAEAIGVCVKCGHSTASDVASGCAACKLSGRRGACPHQGRRGACPFYPLARTVTTPALTFAELAATFGDLSWEAYVTRMRRSREWGDYFCLLAYRHLVFSLDGRGRDACLPSVELYIPDGDSSKVGSRARLLLYVARDPVLCGVRQRRDTVRLLYNGTTHYDAIESGTYTPRDRPSVAKRPLPSVCGDRGALASGKKPKKMAKLVAVRVPAVGLLLVGGVRPAATLATPVADKGGCSGRGWRENSSSRKAPRRSYGVPVATARGAAAAACDAAAAARGAAAAARGAPAGARAIAVARFASNFAIEVSLCRFVDLTNDTDSDDGVENAITAPPDLVRVTDKVLLVGRTASIRFVGDPATPQVHSGDAVCFELCDRALPGVKADVRLRYSDMVTLRPGTWLNSSVGGLIVAVSCEYVSSLMLAVGFFLSS
jgi:hypothetical protein